MRRLQYYVACSVDGFIAHQDGSFGGFLADMNSEAVADFFKSYDWFDMVLMGRRTYEVGLKQGVSDPYPNLKSYVFSRTMNASPNKKVELVSENAGAVVRRLKEGKGKDIWLCGGADLAASLFAENLIDGIILKVNPFLMGAGIQLFARVINQTALELIEKKIYDDGLVRLHYRVKT
jgi:dihydrofolate reductase